MMPWSQSSWLNATLACAALGLALAPMARPFANEPLEAEVSATASELSFSVLPDGTRALNDVDGTPAALVSYKRIASGSTISDA